jgi:hypothetical protein
VRNLLIGFPQQIDKLPNDAFVPTVEERRRNTDIACTTGTADTMNIVIYVCRQIVVDDVSDVWNI